MPTVVTDLPPPVGGVWIKRPVRCLLAGELASGGHREVRIKLHSSRAQKTVRTIVSTPPKRGSNSTQPGQQSG